MKEKLVYNFVICLNCAASLMFDSIRLSNLQFFKSLTYLHSTQNPQIIFNFLLDLIHVSSAKSHITLSQICSRASQIIFVLQRTKINYLFNSPIIKVPNLPGMKESSQKQFPHHNVPISLARFWGRTSTSPLGHFSYWLRSFQSNHQSLCGIYAAKCKKLEITKLFQNYEKRAIIIIRDDMRENEIVISGFMHVINIPYARYLK